MPKRRQQTQLEPSKGYLLVASYSKAYYDGITEIVNNLDKFFPKDLLKNHSEKEKRFLAQTLIDHPNFLKLKENFKNTENNVIKAEKDLKNYIFEF